MIRRLFGRVKQRVFTTQIQTGDPVRIALGPNDSRSREYDGEQGVVTDIITTNRNQRLCAVELNGTEDVIYVEDTKVEEL